ncbi:MAG: AAA family ATPase, partial [Lachnospiraceae bacterium]|nr:AAA family ATPase [Lachnospiraceae bacterium]
IIHIMVKALCHKKRLPGGRICTFTHISEKCFDDDDFSKLCKNASGTTIVIELKGDDTDNGIYASGYNRVIDYLTYLVKKYKTDTQFFFVRNITYEGFSNPLIKRLNEDLELVEVREGIGSREDAEKYLERLIKGSKMSKLYSLDDMRYLPKKKRYYPHDVHEAFEKWDDECLKERAYPAYKSHKSTLTEKKKRKKSNSYNELQDMVGLSDVKNLCDEIICSYKMQKVRGRFGLDEQNLSRHMVFTGNPGSAKTTVARLLCDILADEGVLETGKLVECGRADLVGRYVGWTAKAVKSKFWEAKGGILFIDEAYSLVDDSHSFGDEAINTIVQEMENNRDKVIVIFAGYPDKMEEFIDRNEGLRSRIAFHLNFPDYDQDELLEIMKNMVYKRGLEVDENALPVCRDILERACKQKDYGNGRFVRNYLDQAVMRQSIRLAEGKDIREMKSITKEQAKRLTEEDFMVDPKILFKDQTNSQRRIGFLAG